MKKTLLFCIASSFLFAQTNLKELSWVNKEIEAIKPSRKGTSLRSIALLRDPFVFLNKNKGEKKEKVKVKKNIVPPSVIPTQTTSTTSVALPKTLSQSLKLSAIINNSALINGNWYKVGDKVGNYKIAKITPQDVILQNSMRTLKLSTKTDKSNDRIIK